MMAEKPTKFLSSFNRINMRIFALNVQNNVKKITIFMNDFYKPL